MSFVAVTRATSRERVAGPLVARTLLLAVILLASAGGMLATDSAATARSIASAGGDWANLLRAMAALKLLFAGAAAVVVLWRLSAPISATRWGGYALAAGAAWAGPGLIWGLAHIALGALLLHGGLIATAILLLRDPATGARLAQITARSPLPNTDERLSTRNIRASPKVEFRSGPLIGAQSPPILRDPQNLVGETSRRRGASGRRDGE